ncbi:hypothetical protein GPECTOR_19g301 [Gonium pectorale]|uniref:Uncharacterized protein n=1 Tax=Gonium pectorale TaxID=33097 RepID=A0A150GKH2_GONPE|nr:hypothetical protein GPECTOR_19g301 [Gonium pectorale]|eukprot:KXZ49850.1 hypothetical protein GPECTOR_19g301 [Gonium pectorale]
MGFAILVDSVTTLIKKASRRREKESSTEAVQTALFTVTALLIAMSLRVSKDSSVPGFGTPFSDFVFLVAGLVTSVQHVTLAALVPDVRRLFEKSKFTYALLVLVNMYQAGLQLWFWTVGYSTLQEAECGPTYFWLFKRFEAYGGMRIFMIVIHCVAFGPMTIRVNGITGISDTFSTGQLLALLLGIMTCLRSIWHLGIACGLSREQPLGGSFNQRMAHALDLDLEAKGIDPDGAEVTEGATASPPAKRAKAAKLRKPHLELALTKAQQKTDREAAQRQEQHQEGPSISAAGASASAGAPAEVPKRGAARRASAGAAGGSAHSAGAGSEGAGARRAGSDAAPQGRPKRPPRSAPQVTEAD